MLVAEGGVDEATGETLLRMGALVIQHHLVLVLGGVGHAKRSVWVPGKARTRRAVISGSSANTVIQTLQ
jgi:hypothetical protein